LRNPAALWGRSYVVRERSAVSVKIGPTRYLLKLVPVAKAALLAIVVSMITSYALDTPVPMSRLMKLVQWVSRTVS
jgi:hypothetical protein